MRGHLTHILAASALAATLAGSITTSAQAIPLPVTSAQEIAGAAPTEQVQWRGGWGWRGYGRGIAAGAIAGGLLGLATGAAASSYYGYSYPYYGYGCSYPSYSYSYPSYSYGYYPSYYGYSRASYAYPSYYGYSTASYAYPSYYGYSPSSYYGGYWSSGRRVHKHKHTRYAR
jgi:hypothetical protein